MALFSGKTVVLGVTGGIAAYKAAELVRRIVQEQGRVHVVMTAGAREFITPLTLQTLSGNPVVCDLFSLYREAEIGHIALAERADVLAVVPATANCIGKVAAGIADDMLSTVIMATRAPVAFAPAMNVQMWHNPVVQANVARLQGLGYRFIGPGTGALACGDQGDGRLIDTDIILESLAGLCTPQDFRGCRALVTAGPTREPVDPVRFLSNRSSGKMGYALARVLARRGAAVTLVSGPVALACPPGVDLLPVTTAAEMAGAVACHAPGADLIVMAAAVADYRPVAAASHKLKKTDGPAGISLERTEDILAGLGRHRQGRCVLVGFAAETEHLREHARKKLTEKNLDLIVANDVSGTETGFASDLNRVTLLGRDGSLEELPVMSKADLAGTLCDRVRALVHTTEGPRSAV